LGDDPVDAKSNANESGRLRDNFGYFSECNKMDPGPAFSFVLQMSTFNDWADCEKPIPIEEQACNIPKVCKLHSRELRKQRYLYTCKECPDTYPWIKNEFGMDFK
jgi:hypothetical protein